MTENLWNEGSSSTLKLRTTWIGIELVPWKIT